MIKPTVGRVILFYPNGVRADIAQYDGAPLPALIARVWSDSVINVGGFDANGAPFAATSVQLFHEEPVVRPIGPYAEWMPYQKGQAAKTEAIEHRLASGGAQA